MVSKTAYTGSMPTEGKVQNDACHDTELNNDY